MSPRIRPLVPIATLFLATGCEKPPELNIFSIQDDIDLGQQVRDEILADPETYPVLDEAKYADAYEHLRRIRDEVLISEDVEHKDDFEWEVYLIHDDETLNAFCAPGGYIFVYTGIIHYLDYEDHFAGVMGHEIAHAARRHTTDQLTKAYGIGTLLEVALGDNGQIAQDIATGLVGLQFSRTDEAEADEYSVRYLCDGDYASDGAAGFFEKLEAEGGVQIPEFLSTHPSSESRVEDIRAMAGDLGCTTELWTDAPYQAFKDSLPAVASQ